MSLVIEANTTPKAVSHSKLARLLVPGIILLVLGIGNISVGVYKGRQYQRVVDELSTQQPLPELVNASSFARIQFTKDKQTRLYERSTKARSRRDFYELVEFGGKVFLGLSLTILTFGFLSALWYRSIK